MFKSKQVYHHYHLLRLFVEKLICYQQEGNFTIKNINSTRNIRDSKEAFQLIMKPSLTFEECVKIYDSVEKQSITLISLMLTLCRKHHRPFESKRFIEELKKKINESDQAKIIFENSNSRTLDIVLDNLIPVVGDSSSSSDEILHLVKKLHNSSLASLKSFRLDQLLKLVSTSCNEFETSQRIFKILEERNDVSIFARNYHTLSALQCDFKLGFELLLEMHEKKYKVMDSVYLFAFKESIKIGKNQESMELCQMIQQSGTQNRVLVTSAINFYNKCDQYEKAIDMAKQMKKESMDRVSYNCLIQSYIGKDDLDQVFSVLQDMEHNNINPDATTLTIILTACANKKEVEIGMKILSNLEHNLTNIIVINSALNFYNKCGLFEKSIALIKRFKKGIMDRVSYNCLIQSYIGKDDLNQAFEVLQDMEHANINPDTTTLSIILTACTNKNEFDKGLSIITSLSNNFIFSNSHLSSTIMNFYNKFGQYKKAIEITNQMKKEYMDKVSYNCLIQSHIGNDDLSQAFEVLQDMEHANIDPDATTLTIVLIACANKNEFDKGLSVITSLSNDLIFSNSHLSSTIMNFYNKCGQYEKAIEISKQTNLTDTACYNCLIQSHFGNEDFDKGISLVEEMKKKQIPPNATTFTILITECSEKQFFQIGQEIIDSLPRDLIFSNSYLISSIMNFYNKCGKYEMAIEITKQMKKGSMDVAIYNCLIQSYIVKGDLDHAFTIFEEMKLLFIPEETTFLILLTGCADLVSPNKGNKIIKEIILENLDQSEIIKSAMLVFYSKVHNHNKKNEILKQLLEAAPSIISYNCILASYAHHGEGRKALSLFQSLLKSDNQVNEETITITLNALSHSGMVNEAIQIYDSIEKILHKPPSLFHKSVMVDVFSRAGRFSEAEALIGNSNNVVMWKALMSGCRKTSASFEFANGIFFKLNFSEP